MNKWSTILCKNSISKHLLEEIKNEGNNNLTLSVFNVISTEINDQNDFKNLKEAIPYLKDHLSEGLYNAILEEQEEIQKDLKWISTKRGKYILAINNWQESFYTEFRSKHEFDNVFIGGHAARMVIFLTGKVDGKDTFDDLLTYVNSKNPPYKLLIQIEIME